MSELFQCFQTFLRFLKKTWNGWDRIDLRQLYLKAVNKSIAFRDGKKITGIRLSPNTRYLVYQPRLTDALIVIS